MKTRVVAALAVAAGMAIPMLPSPASPHPAAPVTAAAAPDASVVKVPYLVGRT